MEKISSEVHRYSYKNYFGSKDIVDTLSNSFSKFVDNYGEITSQGSSLGATERLKSKLQLYISKTEVGQRPIDYWSDFDSVLTGRKADRINLDLKAKELFNILKNNPFEIGMDSLGDFHIKKLYKEIPEDTCNSILHKVWAKCFGSRFDNATAHFLHCLTEIDTYSDTDCFIAIPISATRHTDIEIKEAGFAIFDAWGDPKYVDVLEAVEDTGISWLDDYKKSIIEDIK